MFSLATLTLTEPVTITLAANPASPKKAPPTRTYTELQLCFQIDLAAQAIYAQIAGIPNALRIYGSDDFRDVVTDSPEQHAERVRQCLGGQAQVVLQALVNGEALPSPPQRPVTRISKLKLRRGLRLMPSGSGTLEDDLDVFLGSNPQALKDWTDAQFLLVSDPLLAESVPQFAAKAGLTTDQISALFQACRDASA